MIRTLKFALRYDLVNSPAIGCCATQPSVAYNHAVDVPWTGHQAPALTVRITIRRLLSGPVLPVARLQALANMGKARPSIAWTA